LIVLTLVEEVTNDALNFFLEKYSVLNQITVLEITLGTSGSYEEISSGYPTTLPRLEADISPERSLGPFR
jgi:hypothetical protein